MVNTISEVICKIEKKNAKDLIKHLDENNK